VSNGKFMMLQQIPFSASENARLESLKCRGVFGLLLIAMRPHQWVKNLFVLAPLLFAMKLFDVRAVGNAFIAAAVFCLLSSALYLINDVIDAVADRTHPEKRLRPIACGALSARTAMTASLLLLAIALTAAFILEFGFGLVAAAYCVVTLGYCLAFKDSIVLDGILIASGFVLRVIGGAFAISVSPTHWLIACAFLLALFLAFSKRRQELLTLSSGAEQHRHVLGQYTVAYLDRVNSVLLGATIVCYALYTVAPETVARFGTDKLIYGTVFVIYGLLRYMALLENANDGGNPSKTLIKDKPLLVAVLCWAIYNAIVVYRSPLGLSNLLS
jgi:4-hydroxybenzoate polyprenyltransferase